MVKQVPPESKTKPTEPFKETMRDVQLLLNKSGRFTPERQAELDRLAEQQRQENRILAEQKLRKESGVFEKYVTADLSNTVLPAFKLTPEDLAKYRKATDRLLDLIDFPATVIMRGINGPGKTHMASALVNEFCKRGMPAYYCRAVDFFTAIKSTFNTPGKTLEDLERKFRRFKLLVLDEIEVRSDSAWENNVLRSLVDARYASCVATVIITNKTNEQIHEYFSPAIIDRINDGGGVIKCDWPSLRGKANAKA